MDDNLAKECFPHVIARTGGSDEARDLDIIFTRASGRSLEVASDDWC